jgi:hypothetical protein
MKNPTSQAKVKHGERKNLADRSGMSKSLANPAPRRNSIRKNAKKLDEYPAKGLSDKTSFLRAEECFTGTRIRERQKKKADVKDSLVNK